MNRWRYYNPSPAGRNVGDCAVRAISKALGIDWETAYALIAMNGFLMNDVPSSNSVWGSVLRQNGFYKSVLPPTCPDCYTAEEFARAVNGRMQDEVFPLLDEMMATIRAVHPKLYNAVLDRLK